MDKIRVAIIGVGNCASSLIQGVQYYRNAKEGDFIPGVMHVSLGGYHIRDIEFIGGLRHRQEQGRQGPVARRSSPSPTTPTRFSDVPNLNVKVERGMTHDGLGKYLSQIIEKAPGPTADIVAILKETKTDVVINYLPVGSEEATKWYVEQVLEAGCAFVNCIPVFIASQKYWQQPLREASGLPIVGDDIKSQVGATILHRTLVNLFLDRGMPIDRTYQLNTGGNTDFLNMLDRERLNSKKISKTNAVVSQIRNRGLDIDRTTSTSARATTFPGRRTTSSASCASRAATSATCPMNLECRLSVEDSPNSAGVVIDAIRCCKLALDNGIAGALYGPSAFFMKSPPKQFTDTEAKEMTEKFIGNFAKKPAAPRAKPAKKAASKKK